MREIKFRAWDDGRMFQVKDGSDPQCSEYELLRKLFGMIREDAIVMQFTGLLDKNGREIYEGDHVKISYDIPEDENGNQKPRTYAYGTVVWDEHSTGWVIECKSRMSVNDRGTVMTSIIHGAHGEREVIGNIYQNQNPIS